TSHLMKEPETFFTPSHAVLYTGISLLTLAAGIGGFVLIRNKEIRRISFATGFKLLIIGSLVSLAAGPSDFLWHEAFGVDGLLSPPHLALITGMLINSIAVVLGLARMRHIGLTPSKEKIVRLAMIPAFAALWFTMIWYVYMFSLPFSNGEDFKFNPNPNVAALIATISLPFLSSIVFLTASKAIGWPGGATSVAVLIIGLNSFANVIPTVPSMISFLPWYLIIAIFPALIADLVLKFLPMKSNVSIKKSEIIAGAIIGCVFYMFSYPMITWVFSIPLEMHYVGMEGIEAINNLTSDFKNSFVSILALTMIPGALMGILGAFLASDKIYSSPKLIHEESHSKNNPNIRRIGKKGD
ncbi:MAG: hypothetical protein WAM88_05120, partial [Nitrososphaeraceae archaeon]